MTWYTGTTTSSSTYMAPKRCQAEVKYNIAKDIEKVHKELEAQVISMGLEAKLLGDDIKLPPLGKKKKEKEPIFFDPGDLDV